MTDVQKQCCLAALGYYPYREIDGIWGKKSEAAAERFMLEHPGRKIQEVVSELEENNAFWETIHHFTREEFRCHCAGKYCDGFPAQPDETLVQLLESIRVYFGKPVILSSGLRCKSHNAAVGGVSNSRHLFGKAADFMVLGVSASELMIRVQGDNRTRYAYIIGNGPYVHVDVA